MKISFFVPGKPATAGSKTGFYNKKAKHVIMAPANKRQKPWMSHVQSIALDNYKGKPITDPVSINLTFFWPRPKSHYRTGKNSHVLKDSAPKKCTTKPDLTKMLRAVEDALTGVIWKDDSQVVMFNCQKLYDSNPGVAVFIQTVDHDYDKKYQDRDLLDGPCNNPDCKICKANFSGNNNIFDQFG